MGRKVLIGVQVLATLLFISVVSRNDQNWISWFIPLLMILLVAANSVWFTRFVSWVIFAVSFFCLLVLLSAYTLRWRLESGFDASPFHRAMLMYIAFIYVSLGQIKILGGGAPAAPGSEPSR